MVDIGDRPILWPFLHTAHVTIDIAENRMDMHESAAEPRKVTLIDTGTETMTGGRLRRGLAYVGDEDFCFIWRRPPYRPSSPGGPSR
jgi:NDP-sugar pyrophosphorylase family protein